jgi:hypothetical protein
MYVREKGREKKGGKEMELIPGTLFNTPFENGCVVISSPDGEGTFVAYDSDGIECEFNTVMVIGHVDYRDPIN